MNIAARSIATKIKRLFSYANRAEYLTPAFMQEVLVNDIPKNSLTYNAVHKGHFGWKGVLGKVAKPPKTESKPKCLMLPR